MAKRGFDPAATELFKTLTEEQQYLLYQAIEVMKQDIILDVTKRFRNYLLAGVSLLTLFGIGSIVVGAVSFVGIRSTVQDTAIAKLSNDDDLRQSVKTAALEEVEDLARIETMLAKQGEQQTIESNLLVQKSLLDLNDLLTGLKKELLEQDKNEAQ